MALNFPGPYAIEVNYSTSSATVTIQHKMLLSLQLQTDPNVGDLFSTMNVKLINGTFVALDVAVENLLTVLVTRFQTTTTVDFVDLWKYTPLSFQRTFVSSYSPTANAGTSAGTTNPAQYELYTWRTMEGNVMRLTLLETVSVDQTQKGYVGLVPGQQNIVDFIQAPTSGFVLGRDTSYPVSFIRASFGQNEALFRKRFR